MNKKVLAILLTLMLIISTTACAKSEEPQATMEVNDASAPATAEESSSETAPSDAEANSADEKVMAYFENMPDHSYKIKQDEFVSKVVADEAMTIIDIRSGEDYGKGHIKGAVNLPWGPAIAEGLNSIPKDKPLYVYCYTGQTAGQAVMTLNYAGFDARSVNLGWNLGISKVDGVDAVTVTDAATLTSGVTEINADVQTALTAYYEGLSAVADSKYKNYKISEDGLKEMVDASDDSIYILSIRSAKDYAIGHIAGASNIPFGKDMASSFSSLPKDKTIVVYCYTGQTAGQTTAALRLMGYDAVSLNAGMGMAANAPAGWANKGFPVESDAISKVEELYANMPDHSYKIAQDEFVSKVVAEETATIIDIRSADDYAKGHIKGAINLPWGTAISENLVNIPSDKPVFVYCYTGQTAGQAVTTLNVAGFDARSVNLGWNLGISKVDGIDAVTATDVTPVGSAVTEISAPIQAALTAYYEGMAALSETPYKNYKVSEDDLKAMVDADDESIYILSIRKADDFALGHIKGAMNIPFGKTMISEFTNLPKDKTIVVYCYTGQTAGQATAALRLMGYQAVSLNGGMGMASNAPMGWANKGFPVVQ
ncbi:rhodanese-like domain-containing protein [Fusibacter sp. 3D3]|uniref:rhodanese-like domain-containing protein n=1 Tax=Fusibacter sp. 3D3 TaxID=1048380 RepID=UPI0008532035|nr:rhodanese-like domain-containing protein [Fusibacter sp. 3D3]GAU78271.1 rhodanese [Fusibacter sp. 3D3]